MSKGPLKSGRRPSSDRIIRLVGLVRKGWSGRLSFQTRLNGAGWVWQPIK